VFVDLLWSRRLSLTPNCADGQSDDRLKKGLAI
jgi:hypothetical protein